MDKSLARKLGKEYRKSLTKELKSTLDESILRTFLSLSDVKNSEKICVYLSIRDEVDTFRMIDELLNLGKQLYAPVVIGDSMVAKSFSSLDELKIGAFNILEPQGHVCSVDQFDIVVVPMVAFNSNLARIGYGKGYYDRFLTEKVKKIGLAYNGQMFDFTPEVFDKPLDYIVTETGVIRCE